MKAVLTVEYRGEDFAGFQRQSNAHSVQAEIERALKIFINAEAKKKTIEHSWDVNVIGSGRTDSGVHAKGQVISFFWPEMIDFNPTRIMCALNGITSPGIAVLSVTAESDEFDARRRVIEKCYCYHFLLREGKQVLDYNRAWRVSENLNISAMIAAAKLFRGEHDFRCFRAAGCSAKTTRRVITRSELVRVDHERLIYIVVGKGFLKQMVRIIAGALVDVGLGKMSHEQLKALIDADPMISRTDGGKTAPAYGLYLSSVKY